MSDILQIRKLPTTISREEMHEHLRTSCQGVHESVLRSSQILRKVRYLLEMKTDPVIVLELMDLMETRNDNP